MHKSLLRKYVIYGNSFLVFFKLFFSLCRDLVEELVPYLKEAIERKQENIKRRRKKDIIRVQLAHVFELIASQKTFALR